MEKTDFIWIFDVFVICGLMGIGVIPLLSFYPIKFLVFLAAGLSSMVGFVLLFNYFLLKKLTKNHNKGGKTK